jgi:hypothetical protein
MRTDLPSRHVCLSSALSPPPVVGDDCRLGRCRSGAVARFHYPSIRARRRMMSSAVVDAYCVEGGASQSISGPQRPWQRSGTPPTGSLASALSPAAERIRTSASSPFAALPPAPDGETFGSRSGLGASRRAGPRACARRRSSPGICHVGGARRSRAASDPDRA